MNNTITAKETHKIYSKVWKNPKRREEYWKWEFNNSKKLKLKGFKIEYVNLLKTHNLKHEDILETMRVMANGKRSIEKWYKNKDLFIFAFAVAAWRNYNYLLKSKFSSREEWLSVLKENLIHKLDRWLASEKNYELLKSLIKDHIKDVDKGLKMFTYFVQINEKIFEEKVFDDPFNQDFVTLKKNLPQAIEDAINYEFAWKFYGNWFKYFIKMKNKHKFLKPKIQFEKLNKITPLKLKQNDFFKGRGLLEVNQLDLANLINSLWGLLANIDKVVHTFMKKNLPLQTKENIDFSQKSPTSIFLKQQNKWIKKIIWINPVIFSLIFHKLIHSAWDKWTPSEVHKIVTWLNSLVTSTSKKITYKDFQFLLNIWNKGLNIEKLEPKSYQNLINLGLQFRNKFLEN